jgi:hypothetical protein
MTQAIFRDGQLLVPHDVGDGVIPISPDHPDYQRLYRDSVDYTALQGTPESNAAVAARMRAKLGGEQRRTA